MPSCRRLGAGREAPQPTKELKRLCRDGHMPRPEFMVDRLQVQSFATKPLDNVFLHSRGRWLKVSNYVSRVRVTRQSTTKYDAAAFLSDGFLGSSRNGADVNKEYSHYITRPDALTYIAQDMANRLRQDIHETAEKDKGEAEWETILCGLSTELLDALAQEVIPAVKITEAGQCVQQIEELLWDLDDLRSSEISAVNVSRTELEILANSSHTRKNHSEDKRMCFELMRLARQRAVVRFELLAGALMSDRAVEDVCQANPFLDTADVLQLLSACSAIMFRV